MLLFVYILPPWCLLYRLCSVLDIGESSWLRALFLVTCASLNAKISEDESDKIHSTNTSAAVNNSEQRRTIWTSLNWMRFNINLIKESWCMVKHKYKEQIWQLLRHWCVCLARVASKLGRRKKRAAKSRERRAKR